MATRRVEKVARMIRTAVSEVIQNRLSDPRIQGLVTVTRVEPAPDLRTARVYLSVLGVSEQQQELSLRGIRHAHGYVQSYLASQMATKNCPTLRFYLDDSLKKGLAVAQLIEQVKAEYDKQEPPGQDIEPSETEEREG